MEKENSKSWYKNTKLIIVSMLSIILVFLAIFEVFFSPPDNQKKEYERLVLTNFRNRPEYTREFSISNSLDLQRNSKNVYYKSTAISVLNDLRIGAKQLGLSNEAVNSNFYIWTKPGVNNGNGDNVNYDLSLSLFNFYYGEGINTNQVSPDDSLNYVLDFFGLGTKADYKVNVIEVDQANTKVNAVRKFEGKPIYTTLVNDISVTISILNGKIISGTVIVIPSDFIESRELKPINRLNADKINNVNFIGELKSDLKTSSNFGVSEGTVITPATVGLRNYQEVYYLFNDQRNGILLLPAYYITGTLVDAKSLTGKFEAILINQDLSIED